MEFLSDRRLALGWVALVGITLLSWTIGSSHRPGLTRPDALVGMIAIVITLVKVRVIMREFMGVRGAPRWIKRVTDGWLATFGIAMVVAYFI